MTSTSRCRLSRERERASRSQDHSQLSNMTLFLNVSADMSFMGNEIWGALTLIWLSNAYIFYTREFSFVCTTHSWGKNEVNRTKDPIFLVRFMPKKLSIISLRSFSRRLLSNEKLSPIIHVSQAKKKRSETCGIWIVKVTRKPQFTQFSILQHCYTHSRRKRQTENEKKKPKCATSKRRWKLRDLVNPVIPPL